MEYIAVVTTVVHDSYILVLSSGPYIPYGISVSATTRVGAGKSRETIVFTREGGMKMNIYTHYSILYERV